MLIVIAAILLVIAALFATDFSANQDMVIGFSVAGGLFLASAFICPDGFCGMYKNKNANRPVDQSNQPFINS